MAVSFSNDIMPIFNQFKGQMMWRFDLTSYEHVKANAAVIYNRISDPDGPMPPPPFDPLTAEQVGLFKQWMNENYPP
ncbi:MAG TPA: hypothetical protein VEU33_11745 [Archangium sp.]|nr:hypothetical protein [Archangium sp.]